MIIVNNQKIDAKTFPDGTPNLASLPLFDDYKRIEILWMFEDARELTDVYMLGKHYKNFFPSKPISLKMPYIPNARMDRIKDHAGRECFTLKWMCELLNSVEFERIDVFDPHSDVSTALLNGCFAHDPQSEIHQALILSQAESVCFPDAGAQKRYADVVSDIPRQVGTKVRNWKTGRIESVDIQGQANGNVLIIDDICSYGGTFVKTVEALSQQKECGKVSLYVSHCEKNVFDGELFNTTNFDRLYTTDSLLKKSDVPKELETRVAFVKTFAPDKIR